MSTDALRTLPRGVVEATELIEQFDECLHHGSTRLGPQQREALDTFAATFVGDLLENELTLTSLSTYLGGFLLALSFTPMVASLTVELMSKAFENLPDRLLMPWLPKLLMMLRPHAATACPRL